MTTLKMVLAIDQKGGLALKIDDNEKREHVVRPVVTLIPETQTHMVGSPSRFRIQPYGFTESYDFQSVLGACYVESDRLYYTPLADGVEEISLHGAVVTSFQVVEPHPAKPSMVFPVENAVDQAVNAIVSCSAYVGPVGQNYVHVATRWQLSTTEDFDVIVKDFTSSTDLTSTVMEDLSYSTSYWVRCMHIAQLK